MSNYIVLILSNSLPACFQFGSADPFLICCSRKWVSLKKPKLVFLGYSTCIVLLFYKQKETSYINM